jgi:methionyl aminopeptidase
VARREHVQIKTMGEIALMREAGLVVGRTLEKLRAAVEPGITTRDLDDIAEKAIRGEGAVPSFKGYQGFPASICSSVNEEVVHGIPGSRVLEPGDIVSIDCGAQFKGWNGDSAITVVVPDPSRPELIAARERLSEVTEGSLWAGIAALAHADRVGEVGDAVQTYIEASGEGYGILRDYVGHGIGRRMHEGPTVFNYRVADLGPQVRPGLCLAIEPMVVSGGEETFVEDDDWTVSTVDGGDGCHWEHSVAVHENGIWVLTAPDGGAAGLAPFGVTPVAID